MDLKKYNKNTPFPETGKGDYVLILYLEKNKDIVIGRCDCISPTLFRAGYYAYAGSAHGPGGLRSRINRHLRKDKKSVWHIDYLRKETTPVEVWFSAHEKSQEKIWADALIAMKVSHPVKNFGNTDDMKSRTHLCYFRRRPSFRTFCRMVNRHS